MNLKSRSLLFVGDFSGKSEISENLFSPSFIEQIRGHDLSWVNLEGPVLTDNNHAIFKAGPSVYQGKNVVSVLKKVGFSGFSLANNHMMDFGINGLENTISNLNHQVYVGAGVNESKAYDCVIKHVNGIKVGFLSFSEWGFGAAENQQGGFAWINHILTNQAVIKTRKQVDFLVIQTHAGVEEVDLPLPEWRMRYKELIDLGADLIVGHHPHVPQGYEIYKGKEIFYSLGNCYFENLDGSISVDGLALSVNIAKFKGKLSTITQVYKVTQHNGIICIGNNVKSELFNLNSLSEKDYLESINKICLNLWWKRYRDYYFHAIERSYSLRNWLFNCFTGNWPKNDQMNTLLLLHNIKIESHRWSTERALEIINLNKYV